MGVSDVQRMIIIEYRKLGMDFYGAAVAAECTPEQIQQLEEDTAFQSQLEFEVRFREKELLEKLNKVADQNLRKGDTKALERLLEITNPNRYNKTTKLAHEFGGNGGGKSPGKITIEFVGSPAPDGAPSGTS